MLERGQNLVAHSQRNTFRNELRRAICTAAVACTVIFAGFLPAMADPATDDASKSTAAEEQKQPGPPLSLAYVPSDVVGLFALRPQGFFGLGEFKVLDRWLNIPGTDFRNPIAVTQIEQITMAVIRPNADRPPPAPGMRLDFDINIIRSRVPVDWERKKEAVPFRLEPAEHAGKQYFTIPEQPNVCFWPVDAHTYVLADQWTLKRVIEQAPGDAAKLPWGDAWSEVANAPLGFAFESEWAAQSVKGRNLQGADTLLKDTKALLASLEAERGVRWRVLVNCADEELANKKMQAAKALIGAARLLMKPKAPPTPQPDGKLPPPSSAELTNQLLMSAEFVQSGHCAIVTMRSEIAVPVAMQVVVGAVGQFFGTGVSASAGRVQFGRPVEATPTAVPAGVVNSPAMAKRRALSKENLARVAAALSKYHERTSTFPARASKAADGKPLLSWRVHLLPDLGYEELYREFHLDEAWDSEHNAPLVAKMPREYGGSLAADAKPANGNTLVVAVVGPQTCFPEDGTTSVSQIADGIATTELIAESRGNTPWTRPADLGLDASGKLNGRLGGVHPGGVVICTADGKSHFVRDANLSALLPGLLTIAGNETIDLKVLGEE
jgi:Protein of unknown function (DUF1559)